MMLSRSSNTSRRGKKSLRALTRRRKRSKEGSQRCQMLHTVGYQTFRQKTLSIKGNLAPSFTKFVFLHALCYRLCIQPSENLATLEEASSPEKKSLSEIDDEEETDCRVTHARRRVGQGGNLTQFLFSDVFSSDEMYCCSKSCFCLFPPPPPPPPPSRLS